MKIRLTKKTECTRLTLSGWISLVCVLMITAFLLKGGVHSFLAVSRPLKADILVIDGLMPGYAYDSVVKFIDRDKYKYVIATGVELDYSLAREDSYNVAEVSYRKLISKHISNCNVEAAPCSYVIRDRTYSSALALKKWMADNGLAGHNFNLVSNGCHARRSWHLYRKAFRKELRPGIISITDLSYDPSHWYKSSQGVRIVLGEIIAYTYNVLFFHPKPVN